LTAVLLTGCSTVNYSYKGRACDVLDENQQSNVVLLRCQLYRTGRDFK